MTVKIGYIEKFKRWMSYNPPSALTSEGWSQFRREYREVAPVRYFVNDTFRRKLMWPIKHRYGSLRRFIFDRTFNKYHVLKTGLPVGYASADKQVLHVNFNMLKNCVEVHYAWIELNGTIVKHSLLDKIPFYRAYRFSKFRNPELGLNYLKWAVTLDDPSVPVNMQSPDLAVASREILFLYKWWIDYLAADETNSKDWTYEADEAADERNTEMLVRLMRVRKYLDT